jgi:hypothetical protein
VEALLAGDGSELGPLAAALPEMPDSIHYCRMAALEVATLSLVYRAALVETS